jgi:hypothetical protein
MFFLNSLYGCWIQHFLLLSHPNISWPPSWKILNAILNAPTVWFAVVESLSIWRPGLVLDLNNYGPWVSLLRGPFFLHSISAFAADSPGLVDVTLPQHLESYLGPMPVTEVSAVSCHGEKWANFFGGIQPKRDSICADITWLNLLVPFMIYQDLSILIN